MAEMRGTCTSSQQTSHSVIFPFFRETDRPKTLYKTVLLVLLLVVVLVVVHYVISEVYSGGGSSWRFRYRAWTLRLKMILTRLEGRVHYKVGYWSDKKPTIRKKSKKSYQASTWNGNEPPDTVGLGRCFLGGLPTAIEFGLVSH